MDKQYIIQELERMARQSLDRAKVEEASWNVVKDEHDLMVEKVLTKDHTQYHVNRCRELSQYQQIGLVRSLREDAEIFLTLVDWLQNDH